VHEQINVEFRAEGFDVLNHHNFYAQEGYNDVGDWGYGVPIPVYAPKGASPEARSMSAASASLPSRSASNLRTTAGSETHHFRWVSLPGRELCLTAFANPLTMM